ncbi:hypothetical protein Hanom_Chr05g00427311 [Helianthus anomalus]
MRSRSKRGRFFAQTRPLSAPRGVLFNKIGFGVLFSTPWFISFDQSPFIFLLLVQ